MKKNAICFLACLCLLLSILSACGEKPSGKGFYTLASEDNQNSVMPYTCTYKNSFDKKTRTLTFTQIDEEGNEMGFGLATYDKEGNRLTYKLQDGNKNTYLSQEFTYDKAGNCTEIYTRMLGSPDCMEYLTYENGVRIGGMLCYYDENGEITSTELYRVQETEQGSVMVYYETDGSVIATSYYRQTFDDNGNLLNKTTYGDCDYKTQTDRVDYTYKWIALD